MQRSRYLQKRPAIAAVVALAIGAMLAGCAGSPTPASSSAAPDKKVLPLEVGIPSPSASGADFYWAYENGIFTKLGLDVTIVSQGSVEEPNLASGKLVLGQFGTPGMFAAVDAGRKMSVVYNEISGNNNSNITVAAKATYKSIQDLSGVTVGVVGANGAAYGAANAYSNYIVKHGGKALTIQVISDISTETADLTKGSIQAIVGPAALQAAIGSGIAKYLVKAGSSEATDIMGKQTASISYHGLASELAKNKEAITRFVAAMRISLKQVQDASPAQIAAVMGKNSSFAPSVISADDLADTISEGAKPFFAKNGGYVSKDDWKASLTTFSGWGLNVNGTPLNLKDPKFAYANTVDMSYWNDATSLVNSYKSK